MNNTEKAPFAALERVFHEPNRLAILSALCGTDEQLSYSQVKKICGLTDGNMNRHLTALQDEGVIRLTKAFVDLKPRTTIHITEKGLARFNEYLVALDEVLKSTRKRVPTERRAGWLGSTRRAEA